jgi:hypothetical protein
MTASMKLLSIKVVHTVIWLFFVVVIGYILYAGIFNSVDVRVWIAIGLILFEGLVLLLNDGKCPLTPLAARYTDHIDDNFDIFLPKWLARNNKLIFTGLYVFGLLLIAYRLLK